MRKSYATIPPLVPGTDFFLCQEPGSIAPCGCSALHPAGNHSPLHGERVCHANKHLSLCQCALVLPASSGPFPVSPVTLAGGLQWALVCRPVACPALPWHHTLRPSCSSAPHPQPRGSLGVRPRGHLQSFRFLKASVRVSPASPILFPAAVGLSLGIPALQLPGRAGAGSVGLVPLPPCCCQPGFPESHSMAGDGQLQRTCPQHGRAQRTRALPVLEGCLEPSSRSGTGRVASGHGCSRNPSSTDSCLRSSVPASDGEFLAAGTAKSALRGQRGFTVTAESAWAAERDWGPRRMLGAHVPQPHHGAPRDTLELAVPPRFPLAAAGL